MPDYALALAALTLAIVFLWLALVRSPRQHRRTFALSGLGMLVSAAGAAAGPARLGTLGLTTEVFVLGLLFAGVAYDLLIDGNDPPAMTRRR